MPVVNLSNGGFIDKCCYAKVLKSSLRFNKLLKPVKILKKEQFMPLNPFKTEAVIYMITASVLKGLTTVYYQLKALLFTHR